MTYPIYLKYLPAAAMAMSLAACSSSSSTPAEPLEAQAVDGYVVGADVLCDGEPAGVTQAAGSFTCPAGTSLSTVSGGYDVGINDIATTGTVPFTGILKAPATEPYVTPMTTLWVALAQDGESSDDTFDGASYQAALDTLVDTLGINPEILTKNPVVDLEAAKSNAKIHQVLAAFAPNVEAYEEATAAFAEVIAVKASTGAMISLSSDVTATMDAINETLDESNSSLHLATADFDQATANVTTAFLAVERSQSPGEVSTESQKALIDQAPVTIDRNDAIVTLSNDALAASEQLSFDEFENPLQTDGLYDARFYAGLTSVSYDNSVFQFNQDINSAQVTMAFEIESVHAGDQRSLSITSDDVVVNANRGQPDSLVVSMKSDKSVFRAVGTDSSGVLTDAIIETDGETLKSNGSTFTINLDRINQQLANLGFEDILESSGDYSVTLVINGLRINERNGNDTSEATQFTIETEAFTVSGDGFRGYVSFIR